VLGCGRVSRFQEDAREDGSSWVVTAISKSLSCLRGGVWIFQAALENIEEDRGTSRN
jgi:hypothetical protein